MEHNHSVVIGENRAIQREILWCADCKSSQPHFIKSFSKAKKVGDLVSFHIVTICLNPESCLFDKPKGYAKHFDLTYKPFIFAKRKKLEAVLINFKDKCYLFINKILLSVNFLPLNYIFGKKINSLEEKTISPEVYLKKQIHSHYQN